MDKFSAALFMVASASFWSVLLLIQLITSTPVSVFIVFLYGSAIFGAIALYGCIGVMHGLWKRERRWYLGLPLAAVLAGGVLSASGFITTDLASRAGLLGSQVSGIFVGQGLWFLLAMGLCEFLLMLALFPCEKNRYLAWGLLIAALICAASSLSYILIMAGSLIFFIFHLAPPTAGSVLFGDGDASVWNIVFFCTAGLPFLSLLFLIHACRIANREHRQNAEKPKT